MERRKGIPLVALVIFIALLVAVILTCVIILSANKNKKKQPTQQASEPEPTVQTSTEPEPSGEELLRTIEKEKELNDSTEVQNAFKTVGNKKTFAKYAIYQSGGFDVDRNNVSNELKLILALSQLTNEDMDKDSSTKSVAKTTVEEYAEKIFEESDDINYEDVNLYNSDENFLSQYKVSGFVYDQETDKYKVKEEDVTEENPSAITEVITRADIYTNKIELYVKPIFTESFIYEEEYAVTLNYDYDFQQKEFTDTAFSCLYSEYESQLLSTYNRDLDGFVFDSISGIDQLDFNSLKEYKYTLIKKGDDYKIKSFELVTKENEKPEVTELNADQKNAFNFEIEQYRDEGTGVSSSNIVSMLESIISLNENYIDNAKNVVGVKLTVGGETYDKTVSESDTIDVALVGELNGKINDMLEAIDSDSTYTVTFKYKDGVIKTVTIKEE